MAMVIESIPQFVPVWDPTVQQQQQLWSIVGTVTRSVGVETLATNLAGSDQLSQRPPSHPITAISIGFGPSRGKEQSRPKTIVQLQEEEQEEPEEQQKQESFTLHSKQKESLIFDLQSNSNCIHCVLVDF